ncbi:MAG: hypothetical protein KBS91_00640, partial [Firmicutes bacterium]|nr:hypothetical protein [Candidatus Caballimonas caccae]
MEFTIPTTKAQMYTTLKSIYAYYRINSSAYHGQQRAPLSLNRLTFTPLSDSALLSKAEDMVVAGIERERQKAKLEIEKEIDTLNEKKNEIQDKYSEIVVKLEDEYNKIKEKLKEEASKKGLSYSSMTTEKMYQAEKDKSEKNIEIQIEKNGKITEINSKITILNNKLDDLDDFYDDLLVLDKNAKFIELKEAQDKTLREIQKYNNGQSEKEARYLNANLLSDATLELRYLDIKAKGVNKD